MDAAQLSDGRLIICPPTLPPYFIGVATGDYVDEVQQLSEAARSGAERIIANRSQELIVASTGSSMYIVDLNVEDPVCAVRRTTSSSGNGAQGGVLQIDAIGFWGDTTAIALVLSYASHYTNYMDVVGVIKRGVPCDLALIDSPDGNSAIFEFSLRTEHSWQRQTTSTADGTLLVVSTYTESGDVDSCWLLQASWVDDSRNLTVVGGPWKASASPIGNGRIVISDTDGLRVVTGATGDFEGVVGLGRYHDPVPSTVESDEVFCWDGSHLKLVNISTSSEVLRIPFSKRPVKVVVSNSNDWLLVLSADSTASMFGGFEAVSVGDTPAQQLGVSLHPNPASTHFVIHSDKLISSVRVVSLMGSIVAEVNIGTPSTEVELDVSTYPAGMVIVMVQSSDGITTERLSVLR